MPDDPERTGAPSREDTANSETHATVAATTAADSPEPPPALTRAEVKHSADDVIEAHVVDPDRRLSSAEMLKECTRLAVGSAGIVAFGLRRMLEKFGIPEDELEAVIEGRQADLRGEDTAGAGADAATSGIARTALIGMIFDMQESLARRAGEARASALGAGGSLANALSGLDSAPVLGQATRRARETVARWYVIGLRERDASRVYAQHTIEGASKVGLDWIVEGLDVVRISERLDIGEIVDNLELTNVIVGSTGSIAENAIDSVRSQGVGADSFVERVVDTVLRRKPRSDEGANDTVSPDTAAPYGGDQS